METIRLPSGMDGMTSSILTQEEIDTLMTELNQVKMSGEQTTKEDITIALAALEGETQKIVFGSSRLNKNLEKAWKKIWRQVLVIWTVGLILAISYISILTHRPEITNQTHNRLIHQMVGGIPGTDISSESSKLPIKVLNDFQISEQDDLIKLLGQIREAHLKKDIDMFMEAYSPNFSESIQKRKTTLSIWKKYTYLDAQFTLRDLQQENPLTILGKVIWNIKAQDQKTGTLRVSEKPYSVVFHKQSGKWLIYKIDKIHNK
jgi:hypothetical protein